MKILNKEQFIQKNSELYKILRKLPPVEENGPWIAGSSLWRSFLGKEIETDVDFFFCSGQQLESYLRIMGSIPYCNRIIGETKKEYSTSYKFHVYDNGFNKTVNIQFVHFGFWNSIKNLLNDFDLTVCQFAFDGNHIYTGDNSLKHLADKKIIFNKIGNPYTTEYHFSKYINYGFSIDDSQKNIYKLYLNEFKKNQGKNFIYKKSDYPSPINTNRGRIFINTVETQTEPEPTQYPTEPANITVPLWIRDTDFNVDFGSHITSPIIYDEPLTTSQVLNNYINNM